MTETAVRGGSLEILSAGIGHLKITFDKSKPDEVERAKNIIDDMLKKRFTILVEHDGTTSRVKKFDPKREVYIVEGQPEPATEGESPASHKKRRKDKEVPMRDSEATAVGRSAGG